MAVNCTMNSGAKMRRNIAHASVSVKGISFDFDLDIARLAKTDVKVLIEEGTIERIFGIPLEVSHLLDLIVDVSEFTTPLLESVILHHLLERVFGLTCRDPLQLSKELVIILKERMLHNRSQLL